MVLSEKIFIMKTFLIFLILIFCFQFWAKADDIRDFQIEGMSIGDSSLTFSEDELSNARKINYPNSKNFYEILLENLLIIMILLKSQLKKMMKYTVYAITGSISFTGEEDKCLTKKEIDQNFMNILPSLKNNYKHVYKTVMVEKVIHMLLILILNMVQLFEFGVIFTKATLEKNF